jgi:hypothetical protein
LADANKARKMPPNTTGTTQTISMPLAAVQWPVRLRSGSNRNGPITRRQLTARILSLIRVRSGTTIAPATSAAPTTPQTIDAALTLSTEGASTASRVAAAGTHVRHVGRRAFASAVQPTRTTAKSASEIPIVWP